MKINQAGRSMIEMLGVLAIVGVLSAAGLYGYQKAMAKHKKNTTIDQMVTIVNNMHTVFSNTQSDKKPYQGIDMAKLIILNVFPEEMVRGSKVYNLYQGEVNVTIEDDGESFSVDFENLPPDVAAEVGAIDWGTADTSGLQEIEIMEPESAS